MSVGTKQQETNIRFRFVPQPFQAEVLALPRVLGRHHLVLQDEHRWPDANHHVRSGPVQRDLETHKRRGDGWMQLIGPPHGEDPLEDLATKPMTSSRV
jgi:hypothetical protein